MKTCCRVRADGIAHLFLDLDYGRVCVCGRKAFVFSLDTEEPTLRDVIQEPVPPWLTAPAEQKAGNARFLL